jgi:hypothetical protein
MPVLFANKLEENQVKFFLKKSSMMAFNQEYT